MKYSNFTKAFPLWLMLCLAVFLPGIAKAEVAANVHFATGYVTATASGSAVRELSKGDNILSGDTIDTAENARIQMRFTDGGLVSLMPNTTFSVEEYLHENLSEEDGSLVFGLLRGGLRTVTGAIGKTNHDQYELKTPVATLGIRGTEYTAVLRPANTLRVHVGRGKVVITNDHGSLEVPEGRMAVVTLGNAPEYTEQGPQYQASGPVGDRLHASGDIRRDPTVMDPRLDMPTAIDTSALEIDLATVQPGPAMMALAYSSTSGASLISVLSPDLVFGLTPTTVVTSGDLTWGNYSGGVGTINGDPISLGSTDMLHFVTGESTPINNVPTGDLRFELAGHSSDPGVTLNQFNLDINLANLNYSLGFDLDHSASGNYSYSGPGGQLNSNSTATNFSFNQAGISGSNCNTGCSLDVQGFIAGSNANQAGVSYQLDTGGGSLISGAAALDRVP